MHFATRVLRGRERIWGQNRCLNLLPGPQFKIEAMSFVLRRARGEIDREFHRYRRAARFHEEDQVAVDGNYRNSRMFLLTVLLLLVVLNSLQASRSFLIWLLLGVFLTATAIRMRAMYQQYLAHALANSTASELHLSPPVLLAAGGRQHVLRLQLAVVNRDFSESDYDGLRSLDADNDAHAPTMTEEEINALPVREYMIQMDDEFSGSRLREASSSSSSSATPTTCMPLSSCVAEVSDLTCSVCLEQVNSGEFVRSLPCLHQFHVECIDPWLRQQGTCPVCKYSASSWWPDGAGSGHTAPHLSRMV